MFGNLEIVAFNTAHYIYDDANHFASLTSNDCAVMKVQQVIERTVLVEIPIQKREDPNQCHNQNQLINPSKNLD
uniref:Uncharacterized protein n=1 Tax=Syphacia muris TaxID=451379 RepID=A0A0N5AJX7_9BILA